MGTRRTKRPTAPGKQAEPLLTAAQRRSLVERRIAEAMEAGAFDNLRGAGKPLAIDEPPPRHADLWWTLRLLKNANVVPDEVRYRRQIDDLRAALRRATAEPEVRRIVREINGLIVRLNTMGTNVIPTSLVPIDEDEAVRRL